MPEFADTVMGLRVGDNIAVRMIDGMLRFFRITNRDDIIHYELYTAIASGATQTYTAVTNLDPASDELYQLYATGVDGNVLVYVRQPAATQRWGTNRSPTGGPITDRISPLSSGYPICIWVLEDYPPNVQITNSTNISITPRMWWFGWRYTVDILGDEKNSKWYPRLKEGKPRVYTTVQVGGVNR